MKRTFRNSSAFLTALLLLFAVVSTASAKGVKTEMTKPSDMQPGTYTVLTTTYPVPVAILQKGDQPYHISFRTTGSSYKVYQGLSQDQAISKAKSILEKDPAVQNTDLAEIKGPDGVIIGYEMNPVYKPLYFGSYAEAGLGTVSYKIKGNDVFAYVTPNPIYASKSRA